MTDREDIIEVLARYVRANDTRNGSTLGELFTKDVLIEIFQHDGRGGRSELAPPTRGRDTLVDIYDNLMPPHEPDHWSHHVTSDHIVKVDGDRATLSAQFMMFRVRGVRKPDGGWPAGTFGAQGTITPEESGYYETDLVREDGVWRIAHHRVLHDIPFVIPAG
ncbi:nuclear transport factor 2 family protein [Streptomyces sp. J2-1]|uniref:nuclear transport factor 2 family protein n=1 Tax=Streptomyces corallincola TaxID=2851888 RepID=UPI001C386EAC|nr:nuclear transport factor 2 family protein [Streptomyces corallincola]MBV2353970.1 nuclear transport factor 2 family protein [Streptomyces corallincola]